MMIKDCKHLSLAYSTTKKSKENTAATAVKETTMTMSTCRSSANWKIILWADMRRMAIIKEATMITGTTIEVVVATVVADMVEGIIITTTTTTTMRTTSRVKSQRSQPQISS